MRTPDLEGVWHQPSASPHPVAAVPRAIAPERCPVQPVLHAAAQVWAHLGGVAGQNCPGAP
eukprot:9008779-Lingulodinium_polyedra.AAC.1